MATLSCSTLRNAPRRLGHMVNAANQRSTRLSHGAYVGVKWTWKRERLANQFPMNELLCVS
jgi:hypothetical protein